MFSALYACEVLDFIVYLISKSSVEFEIICLVFLLDLLPLKVTANNVLQIYLILKQGFHVCSFVYRLLLLY